MKKNKVNRVDETPQWSVVIHPGEETEGLLDYFKFTWAQWVMEEIDAMNLSASELKELRHHMGLDVSSEKNTKKR